MKSRAHAHSKIELKSQVFRELQRALVLMMNRPQEYTNVRWKIRKKTVRIRWLKNTMVLLLHGRLAVNNNNNNNKSYSEFCFTIERKKERAHTTNDELGALIIGCTFNGKKEQQNTEKVPSGIKKREKRAFISHLHIVGVCALPFFPVSAGSIFVFLACDRVAVAQHSHIHTQTQTPVHSSTPK